ncbi:MAG: hypothetical protein ACYSSI_07645 [Planctomycetota bacterium]|jgi:hypothetical protein
MIRWFLYIVFFIVSVVAASGEVALGQEANLSVEIDAKDVIVSKFMGFGVEWDSANYHRAGITREDFAVIRNRIEWMRLPVARIMILAKWCYKGDGKYDWTSQEMRDLYRHLGVCQSLGITVFLTDWGCYPDAAWLKCPDVAGVDDPKYAEIIGTYLSRLRRKYTCIKYFILVNEPNGKIKDFSCWRKGVEQVFAEMQKRGLDKKIVFSGSDQVFDPKWHYKAVDQLQHVLGAYDFHRYTRAGELRAGGLYNYIKKHWDYSLANDPKAKEKPLVIAEGGIFVKEGEAKTSSGQNPAGFGYQYGVDMTDYAVQAASAGSWSVLAWMLDDNSHNGFTWGMWTSKSDGLKLKPWFYTWSLLCRYFPPESSIVRAKYKSKDVRVLAAYRERDDNSHKKDWSFCLVNRANKAITARLQVPDEDRLTMYRYLYSKELAKTNADGFALPLENREYDLKAGVDILCEANSVVILTSIGD